MINKRSLWIPAGLLFLAALGSFVFNEYRIGSTINKIREKTISIASGAVLGINAEEVIGLPLEQRNEDTLEYKMLYEKLIRIKQSNPYLEYVYIMATTGQWGILQYVIDADPVPQIITAKSPTAFSGDTYDARNLPEMIDAFKGATADREITTDAWGVFISGYAPIRDIAGNSVAILGVDVDARPIQAMQKTSGALKVAILSTGILLLVSLIAVIF